MKVNATLKSILCLPRATWCFFISIFFLSPFLTQAQGRVLVNEYLPWPNNACGVTAEFIELYNFGPGPANIGGYIITDGDYAITIPANTILSPGEYFVLAGQDIIPQDCGNDLRNVTVNLNWNTCGCTSAPIPTTGEGFITDGGGSNEQVVLLDSNLNIIDAIARSASVEPSSLITTSTVGGQYTARTFDLDNMNIQYETIGESVGRGNSLARKIDGGCGWIKDTQESAGDVNNTPGESADWDANLTITNPTTCSNTGSVEVTVSNTQMFPMHYTLAKDLDGNYSYTLNDSYNYGTDSTAPVIPLTGLEAGVYQLIVESNLGCNLTMFDFSILGCNNLILEQVFTDVKSAKTGWDILLCWNVPNREIIQFFDIEQSNDGRHFARYNTITETTKRLYDQYFYTTVLPVTPVSYYRIKLTTKKGAVAYSPVITVTAANENNTAIRIAENPFTSQCTLLMHTGKKSRMQVKLYDLVGRFILEQKINVQEGNNTIRLSTQQIHPGMYLLQLNDENGSPLKTMKVFKR